MAVPRVAYGFFCEHVRPELGGKTTVIGLWGTTCIFSGSPPGILPSLGFHAHLMHEEGKAVDAKLSVDIPGMPPLEEQFSVGGERGKTGHNININFGALKFDEPTTITADLVLLAEPPVTEHFELRIAFRSDATGPASER